jgi:glucose-1-phosphate cytidylyltransferase
VKTVILCGGRGTRLSEETLIKPKPMVEIGGRPMLWHIMKIYAHYGFKEFILALGYKGEVIKDYFMNYHPLTSDITVDLATGKISYKNPTAEDWLVHLVDTGRESLTGGRLHRLESILRPEGTFMLTYGDGVIDLDIRKVLAFHRQHGRVATVTAVRPQARFGNMVLEDTRVIEFKEKSRTKESWINGGFFVFNASVFDYLHGDDTLLEGAPLENLSRDNQLMAYPHHGFWYCMDTVRDLNALENFWKSGTAPWKV